MGSLTPCMAHRTCPPMCEQISSAGLLQHGQMIVVATTLEDDNWDVAALHTVPSAPENESI
jgi:hypothetical protein